MLKNIIGMAGILLGITLFPGGAMAAADWGPCVPDNGAYNFNALIDTTITEATKNVPGVIIPDFYTWDLAGGYTATCECPNNTSTSYIYFHAVPPLAFGHVSGSESYYVVDDKLQVSTKIYIAGNVNDYIQVPFDNQSTGQKNRSSCDVRPETKDPFKAGSRGKLSIYLSKSISGLLAIPATKIVDLYATRRSGVYSSIPMTSISISGTITVPQSCELSAGTVLEIPFGEYQSRDFKDRAGQTPQSVNKIQKDVIIKCNNIPDGIQIYLSIDATPNSSYPNAIDVGNPDVGAIIEGANGNVLVPNDRGSRETLSVGPLDVANQRTAKTTITAYPVSTTGNPPSVGDYEGVATLHIEVE